MTEPLKTNLWERFKAFPKIAYLRVRFGIAKKLIQMRNRPPKVLKHPHRKLKIISESWDFEHSKIQDIVDLLRKMNAALYSMPYGMRLGLAAPQIGINKRVFIMGQRVIVNPEWNPSKAPPNEIVEGCYSVPGRMFKVPRAQYGWAKYQTFDGKWVEEKLKGLDAIVFQHELDHLDGKCCIDIGIEQFAKPGVNLKPIQK